MAHLSTRPQLTGTALKRIACVSMLLDHIGASLLEAGVFAAAPPTGGLQVLDLLLRWAGRLAFPLYCFLLVEGFAHTHSVSAYLKRLVLFGLLSEIPFDLAFYRTAIYPAHQNVYWTLALGVAAMLWMRQHEQNGAASLTGLLGALVIALCAEGLHTDYGAIGVLLIATLFLYRTDRLTQCLFGGVITAYELPAPLAFTAAYFYNGERGRCGKVQQWVFYWFYPVHLALLAALGYLLF